MNLRDHLRNEWSEYIRPMVIKNKCEFCGADKELHLHHIDRFYNLLMETLEYLQLQEMDTTLYTDTELTLISHIMLSKQIRTKYKTLCKDCHCKLHYSEKNQEEYKKYYYNPNGQFILLNIEKIKNINIDNNILTRFIMLGCFIKFGDNILVYKKENGRYKTLKKDDLNNILNLSKTEYYRTINILSENDLIYFDDYNVFINKDYIVKGNSKDNNMKIFTDNYKMLYNTLNSRSHKILSSLLMDFINDTYNYNNLSRLKQYIKNINVDFIKFDGAKPLFNPCIFYKGELTKEYKIKIEEYFNN